MRYKLFSLRLYDLFLFFACFVFIFANTNSRVNEGGAGKRDKRNNAS